MRSYPDNLIQPACTDKRDIIPSAARLTEGEEADVMCTKKIISRIDRAGDDYFPGRFGDIPVSSLLFSLMYVRSEERMYPVIRGMKGWFLRLTP